MSAWKETEKNYWKLNIKIDIQIDILVNKIINYNIEVGYLKLY